MQHGRRLALAAACASIALGGLTGPASAHYSSGADTAGPRAALEAGVLRQMNVMRVRNGAPPLRRVAVLARPARAHSAFMAASGTFQHEGADGSPFWSRLVRAGFPRTRTMAENIAMVSGCDPSAAAQVVRLWMNSPGHRANLLDRRMRTTGVGVVATEGCAEVLVTADYGG